MAQNFTNEQDILQNALELYQDEWLADLPDDEELQSITFSDSFEKRMDKMMEVQKTSTIFKFNRIGRWVACLFAVILIALMTSVFTAKATANPVIDFFIKVYEKFSTLISSKNNGTSSVQFKAKTPTDIPEGFEVNQETLGQQSYYCSYRNAEDEWFSVSQTLYENAQYAVDTESALSSYVRINGLTGYCFEKQNSTLIIWDDDFYCYQISGSLDYSRLVQIAESLADSPS